MVVALAWRNLWRRPQRTVLSLLSIAIVTALLVFALSFQLGVYATMKETTLRIFDGYAQLQPQGYADDPTLDRIIADPAALAMKADSIRGVNAAAPRINGYAILANGERSYGAAVIGVDPASEAKVSSIAGAISQGRYLAEADGAAAILGETLARNLRLSVGDKVTVLGSTRDGSVAADVLKVVGVYRTGVPELDRTILEMPLARAQATFAMTGEVNTIVLGGRSLSQVDAALPRLRVLAAANGIAVRDWADMEPAMRDALDLKYATSMLFYLTLVVVVAFIMLNTLLMSVLERTREFGMQLAMGMRAGQIGATVWIELMGLALVGCAIGLTIGAAAAAWFGHRGIEFAGLAEVLAQFGLPSRLYPKLSAQSALIGPGALLAAIAIGGIVPYLRVVRLTPALAMRA